MIDLLPTFAAMAGAALPNRKIDGHNQSRLWFETQHLDSPHDATGFFYYHAEQLQAVRSGPWKLYLKLPNKIVNLADRRQPVPARLFDVRNDPGETRDRSQEEPAIVARLEALAEEARKELGDLDLPGASQRPAGWVAQPTPRLPAP